VSGGGGPSGGGSVFSGISSGMEAAPASGGATALSSRGGAESGTVSVVVGISSGRAPPPPPPSGGSGGIFPVSSASGVASCIESMLVGIASGSAPPPPPSGGSGGVSSSAGGGDKRIRRDRLVQGGSALLCFLGHLELVRRRRGGRALEQLDHRIVACFDGLERIVNGLYGALLFRIPPTGRRRFRLCHGRVAPRGIGGHFRCDIGRGKREHPPLCPAAR